MYGGSARLQYDCFRAHYRTPESLAPEKKHSIPRFHGSVQHCIPGFWYSLGDERLTGMASNPVYKYVNKLTSCSITGGRQIWCRDFERAHRLGREKTDLKESSEGEQELGRGRGLYRWERWVCAVNAVR